MPSDQPNLSIAQHLLNCAYQHAIHCSPHEACGVLSGPLAVNSVDQFHPLANIINQLQQKDHHNWPNDSKKGYLIAPQALLKLEKQLSKTAQAIKVFMHSHLEVGAYFSEVDRKHALFNGKPLYPKALYLVSAVKNNKPDGTILAWFNHKIQAHQTIVLEKGQ